MKLDKATTAELRAELERRGLQRPGRKRTCECGECPTCRQRAKVNRYLEKKRLAAAGR